MSLRPDPNPFMSYVPEDVDYLDVFDECCPCNPADELELLRRRMLKGKSPGAAMLVKQMEAMDKSLSALVNDMESFNPQKHHINYTSDQISRRYIYIKSCLIISFLGYVQETVEKKIRGFDIDEDNTRLYREPEGMAEARAWRANYYQERAKEQREERAARKAAARRSTAQSTAAPSRSKSALKSKVSAGS